MNTPIDNTRPFRTAAIDELAANLAFSGMNIERIKNDASETNATLAMCEIVISTPIEWYSNAERLMVIALVEHLYQRSFQAFVDDVTSGIVSFYNKSIAGTKVTTTMDDIVSILHKKHSELSVRDSPTGMGEPLPSPQGDGRDGQTKKTEDSEALA